MKTTIDTDELLKEAENYERQSKQFLNDSARFEKLAQAHSGAAQGLRQLVAKLTAPPAPVAPPAPAEPPAPASAPELAPKPAAAPDVDVSN
jgi:hypothetical protein